MAGNSPWSLLDPSTLDQIKQLGMKAIASGQISLDDAQKQAQALGLSPSLPRPKVMPKPAMPGQPGDQTSPLAMVNPQAQGPLDMTSQPSQAGDLYSELGDIGDKKGAKVQSERSDTTTVRRGSNRLLTKPMDQIRAEKLMAQGIYPSIDSYDPATDEMGNPIFDGHGKQVLDKDRPNYGFTNLTVDPNDPIQKQEQGLNRMEGLLAMDNDANQKRSLLDLRPLAALADARNAEMGHPTHLTATADAPPDLNSKFMAYADEIQKRRADLQKGIAQNAQLMRGGTNTDLILQALAAKDVAGQQNPTYDRMQAQQERMDNMMYRQTLQTVRNDKTLRDRLVQYQNLSNALNNLANADHITPQQFDETQQAIRANLGIKGNSGVAERDKTQINSLGLSADRIAQILSGKPQDIDKNDVFLGHIKNLAGLEQGNIRQQYRSRLNAATAGIQYVLERHPEYEDGINQVIGANMAQIAPSGASSGPRHKAAAPLSQAQKAVGAGASGGAKPLSIDEFFGGKH